MSDDDQFDSQWWSFRSNRPFPEQERDDPLGLVWSRHERSEGFAYVRWAQRSREAAIHDPAVEAAGTPDDVMDQVRTGPPGGRKLVRFGVATKGLRANPPAHGTFLRPIRTLTASETGSPTVGVRPT